MTDNTRFVIKMCSWELPMDVKFGSISIDLGYPQLINTTLAPPYIASTVKTSGMLSDSEEYICRISISTTRVNDLN